MPESPIRRILRSVGLHGAELCRFKVSSTSTSTGTTSTSTSPSTSTTVDGGKFANDFAFDFSKGTIRHTFKVPLVY